jgi:hypothetical protein
LLNNKFPLLLNDDSQITKNKNQFFWKFMDTF